LGSNPVLSANDTEKPEVNLLNHDPVASQNIISFLKSYEFITKSESGAEYSYYHAKPSTLLLSKVHSITLPEQPDDNSKIEGNKVPLDKACSFFGAFDAELISPADKRQITRALPSLGSTLIEETPELYENVVKPYIQSITDGDSLGWINNVIEVKKEKERLLVNHEDFIVNIDTKWRSHPPPLSTPREEWYGHPSIDDLYCLGIVKSKGIATLRDLRGEHISLLKNIQKEGLVAIEKIYGVKPDQIRCYVHYQPQFYHFHVHFTRLENEIGSTVEKGHLLTDIVQNLEMDPMYYTKRTNVYKLRKDAPLQNLIMNQFNVNA
jgi:m7GpppX diphosphatase